VIIGRGPSDAPGISIGDAAELEINSQLLAMPNGHDRHLFELILAVEGFYGRYGRWPIRVRTGQDFIDEIRSILSEDGFASLTQRLALVDDSDCFFLAEDDQGGRFCYALGDRVQGDLEITDGSWIRELERSPHGGDAHS
jgi:hypothetical protein